MGLSKRSMDPRARRLITLGCVCLSIGLALRIFIHPVALNERILLHVVVGCLLGLFIGLVGFGVQDFYACRADRT